jgi:WD40 repeat protein
MQPGLRILIQLVLEFAPTIAVLVQQHQAASGRKIKNKSLSEITTFLHTVKDLIPQPDLEAEKTELGEFEQEKILQQQLAVFHRQTQLEIADRERETILKLPEIHKILDNWCLRLFPSQILDSHDKSQRKPLRIFIAPPQIQFDRFQHKDAENIDIELTLAEGLREFLQQNYSLHHPDRPTEFLAGAWDSKRFHSESSIKSLFGMLKSEPTLILESEVDGDHLNFRIAYWGFGQNNYYYKTVFHLPYKEIVYEFARTRALEWKQIKSQLLLLGEDLEEIEQIGKDNISNLALLEKLDKWRSRGIDISKLSPQYQVHRQDLNKLCHLLITCHCLVASWVTDAYHLIHHDIPPLLPQLLPSMLQGGIDYQAVAAIATGYQQIYTALAAERRYWIPELSLQLAQSLVHLPDRSWAQEQANYSLQTWLELRQITYTPDSNPLEMMQLALRVTDEAYLLQLRQYFMSLEDLQQLAQVEKNLEAIAHLKGKYHLESGSLRYNLAEHRDRVTSIAISPDGQILVSGSVDRTIKIWDLATGKLIRTLDRHTGEVASVAVSPDGQYLAIGSHVHPQSNVKVWHLATGKLLHTLLGHHKPVNCVTISPDGHLLASGSNKIKIWRWQKGDRICTLWHSSPVNSAAINPDSTILASGGSDSKIRLWNPQTGELLRTLTGHKASVASVAMSADGEILVSGSADNTIKVWHLATGKLLNTLTGHAAAIQAVAIAPDGQTLFSGSADNTIKIWRIDTAELLHTLTGHTGTVNAVAISPNVRAYRCTPLLVSGSDDATIKIWQL